MTTVLADAALAYIGLSMLLVVLHHAWRWREMFRVIESHAVWPRRVVVPIQAIAVVLQAGLGTSALLAFLRALHDERLAPATLVAAFALGIVFLGYVRALHRAKRDVPCGCFFIGDLDSQRRPSNGPALALLVSAGAGLVTLAMVRTPARSPEYSTLLYRGMVLAWAMSVVILVQLLGVLRTSVAADDGLATGAPIGA